MMVVPEIPARLQRCTRHPLPFQAVDANGQLFCLTCNSEENQPSATCFFCDNPPKHPTAGVILENPSGETESNIWTIQTCDQCHADMSSNRLRDVADRYVVRFGAGLRHVVRRGDFDRARREGAMQVVRAYAENPANLRWPEISVDETVRIHGRLGEVANTATKVVLWREDLWRAATRGNIAFQGTDWDLAGLVGQVWLMQTSQPIFLNDTNYRALGPTPLRLLGYVLQRIGDTLCPSWLVQYAVYNIRTDRVEFRTTQVEPSQQSFRIGHGIPEWFCPMTAASAFLNMNLVAVERQTPSRNVRRQAEREGHPEVDIGVIVLRRSVSERRGEEPQEREWSCCWMVASHWRRQWLPSRQTWEPRYIWTHQKGDPTKPLKPPKQGTIYYVKR